MRVCQFRHDGKVDFNRRGSPKAAGSGRPAFLFYSRDAPCQTSPSASRLILFQFPSYRAPHKKIERRNQVDDRKTGGHDQPFIAGKEFSLAAPMQKQWSKANRNPCQRRYNGVGRRTDDFGQSRIYLDTYRSSVQPFLPAGQGTTRPYSSFALMVIFAFSTFDTGHPVSAASAYF
jgi:hypothetical protein